MRMEKVKKSEKDQPSALWDFICEIGQVVRTLSVKCVFVWFCDFRTRPNRRHTFLDRVPEGTPLWSQTTVGILSSLANMVDFPPPSLTVIVRSSACCNHPEVAYELCKMQHIHENL